MITVVISKDEEKKIEFKDSFYDKNRGRLYRAVVDTIERILIEDILQRSDGNQLKAARILGINRNTMRSKTQKLGINVKRWKI